VKEESRVKKSISFILSGIIKINFYSPKWLSYWLSFITSKISVAVNSKSSQTTKENIILCFPQLDSRNQAELISEHLKQRAFMSKETSVAWLGTETQIRDKIAKVIDQSFITDIQKSEQPIIIAVPHIGNWEYFWHWLQLNYSAISMYSPAKFKRIDQLMLDARSQFGGCPYSTDRSGMLNIYKGLKQGKIMMILPDQAPNLGAGIYSPFFAYSAYTMTLLHRLIQKTNAQLLFGACLRNPNGQFDIQLFKPEFDSQTKDLELFNLSLNKQIENIIKTTPEQYLWNYKRFKRQPYGKEIYTADKLRREKHEINNKKNGT
jgi:KDO2-lipid IV(A) lauroyltransferase